jgi:hypothetical protein
MKQSLQMADYRIIVEGALDPLWHDSLGGLVITQQRQPGQLVITQLEGRLIDQSALQGVLDTLFMLGLRLITVECLSSSAPSQFRTRGTDSTAKMF